MTIKTRLRLNTVISLGAVVLIILSLAWSYNDISNANRNTDLVENIRNVAFERIVLRDDYLLHAEERAEIQWRVKSEALRRLLDMADRRFTEIDDKELLREARKDFDATLVSISSIMDHHRRKEPGRTKEMHLTEAESMLINQAFLRAYSLMDSINRLEISAERNAASVRDRSIITVVFFMLAGIMMIIANSMFLGRLLTSRIDTLKTGIEAIGGGDLDHRIDAVGDDELSALARGGNEMAGKLKMSHISVETLQHEITERRKAEEEIRKNEEHLRVALAASDMAVFNQDLDLRYSWMYRPPLGYTIEQLIGKRDADLLPPDMAQRATEIKRRVLETGVGTRGEVEGTWNDKRIYFELAVEPLRDTAGRIVGITGASRDITRRKLAEEENRKLEERLQQAQKMEGLGVLAGGIAHDFNNILMAVLGHAELALKEISPMSPARGNLTEITTAAYRAADLCRQMLAYAGRSSFSLERVGLRELVEEMAHLLKTAISKKAILNLNLERGLPPVQADPSQIRQIVMNLLINASEAIGDRSGVITVSVGAMRCDEEFLRKNELREDLAPGRYIHLEVTDTGTGMDAETRSRIFEPFFSTKFTGRGLGLAAVQGIVRAHKGALKVYTELGKGTTFKILFPALEDVVEGARSGELSSLADWRGQGTILLVDDEESLLALGDRMLEQLGFTVLIAADGLQAVELYREHGKEIDLVLMDLTMPHMDGAEAFGELRRLNPDVRVVLASGYSHDDVESRFEGMHLDGVLQKPYTLAKLRESLEGLMPKRL